MNISKFKIEFNSLSPIAGKEVIVEKARDFEMIDMHTHAFIEIAFVESGHGWHILGEEITRCGPGSVYIIDYEVAHMFMADHNDCLTICNLIFCPSFLNMYSHNGQNFSDVVHRYLLRSFRKNDFSYFCYTKFEAEELQKVSALFGNMLEEYERQEQGCEELIRSWSIELLVYFFRRLCREENNVENPTLHKESLLQCVYDYIEEHYEEEISLEKLARLIFVSPKYFSHLFKTHTGCTVTEYTQKVRVRYACEMLEHSKATVEEIAGKVGYSDGKYFKKVFRRLAGMSPAEYRNNRH